MSSGNQAVSSSQSTGQSAGKSARSWVNQVMVGYQRSNSDVAEGPAQAERQQLSVASTNPFIDSEALQQQQADARLLRLRSMVEELKAMPSANGQPDNTALAAGDDANTGIGTHSHTSTASSGEWLALYRRIGRLSR